MKVIPRALRLFILSCWSLFAGLACVTVSAGITTSNIPLEGRKYNVLGPAETSISWWSIDIPGIVGIPLSRPPVDEAMQELLQAKSGDALINIRYSTDNIIVFFFNIHRFHIKADVIKLEK